MGVAAVARCGHRLGAEAVFRDHMTPLFSLRPARGSPSLIIGLLLLAGSLIALPLPAKTLRFASAFDPQSMDPHGLALQYQTRVVSQIYESLVSRDRNFAPEPALAMSWQHIDPKHWRFKLRPGVKFHDGTPFTADDVVFSIERALAKNSQRSFQLRGVQAARRIDDLTVDFVLDEPDAVLPEKLINVGMMSRAWCMAHGVVEPQNYDARQETYAVRNANGTGPYRLKAFESDVRTLLAANPQWWGRRGNVDEAIYVVIQSDATRMAALMSGQVDFVIDPPFQDVARLKQEKQFKLVEVADIGTQYLGFDQSRDELQFADVKGRNPFKDLRVRRAIYHAIDIDTIVAKVLRGQASATGSYVSRLVDGYVPELDRRLPYDPSAARALLKEAGYPGGFGITLDCVNVAFRAAVCQAIAGMLSQVGIRATMQTWPTATFFPKITQATTSFFEFGWSPLTDAWPTLNAIVHSFGTDGEGTFNGGRYSNPRLDRLIEAIRVEPDAARRRQIVGDALRAMNSDLPLIPLYRRTLTWVMRPNIGVAQWPNDVLELRFVDIGDGNL
ncbi:MAG: ABC transporter substrate-binding protein [Betaproteobacteria bacterium]|nr:MAG: ABC transporter substrate-binding protein [Betaproteobacteria bacterium]